MDIKKTFLIFSLFYLVFMFSALNRSYASVSTSFDSTAPSSNKVSDAFCGGVIQQCWNSWAVGETDCGTACPSGSNTSAWSKYEYSGCYEDPDSLGNDYIAWLPLSSLACSTGDKYNSGNPEVMDAGKCSATAGSCDVGGPYKTCCSGGFPVSASIISTSPPNDFLDPPEADCGGNTEVRCGAPGEPACGIAACGGPPSTPTDVPPEPTSTPVPAEPTPTPTPLPAPTITEFSCTGQPGTLTTRWTTVTGASTYAIRIDDKANGPVTDNPLPGDTVDNDVSSPFTRATSVGPVYETWVHAVDSRGVYSGSSNHVWVTCAGPTLTPTLIPTITPTAIPTPTPGANSINANPEPNQQQTGGAWQQMTIAVTLGTVPTGDVLIKTGSVTTTGTCLGNPGLCDGWTELSGLQNIGPGTYSWNPNGVIPSADTYTFGLFDSPTSRTVLLATDPVNFVALGATPAPTTGPRGCNLTVFPSTVGPGMDVTVTVDGPSGSYTTSCPDGSTRSSIGPGTWYCNVGSSPGPYTVSASGPGGVSCSAPVTVISGCDEELDGSAFLYILAYKDTYWNNSNYLDLNNQWPHRFWCPNSGSCTYGTRGDQPTSNAKRNDATYCGYSTKSGAGTCRQALFPVCTPLPYPNQNLCDETRPGNYSSRYPFNQPLGLYHTWLPNVVIHAENRCESYTGITNSSGQVDNWRNSFGDFIGSQPPGYIKYDDDTREYFEYDVWADVPSGRRFIRGNLFYCRRNDPSCAPAVFPFHESEAIGPSSTPRFEEIDDSRTLGKNVWFGFTNPGEEPKCTGVSADSTIITRGQTVNFSDATGFDPDAPVGSPNQGIVGYAWDFDGNGTIDRETPEDHTAYTYSANRGTFNAKVYLKDNIGLYSFPNEQCTKPIEVSCNTLQVSPNPVTLSPGQTQPLTPEGIDGDPNQLTWTTSDPDTVSITGARCESPPEEASKGHSLLLQLAKFLHLPIAEATHPSCRPGQSAAEKQGSSIQIYAHKEGTATITVSDLGAFNCGLSTRQVVVAVRIPPWFQGTGGDMRIDAGFNDPIPGSVPVNSRYASLEGSGSTPGIVFSGQGTPDFGDGQASKTPYNWIAGGLTYPEKFDPVSSGVIRTSYSYMDTTRKQSGITPTALPCSLANCTLPVGLANGVYKAEGDVHLNAYTFPLGKNYVILVNGNLFIEGNIIVPQGSTATFSVSGDIIVDKSIGATLASTACDPATHSGCHIEGFYSADGDIIIDGNGQAACSTIVTTDDDKRVNFAGAIVANAKLLGGVILNQRDLCGINNSTYPTYTVTERPDFIINAPEFIKSPNSIWQEVAP